MKRQFTQTFHANRAFTLIEIMIVVAIIALLCAIAVPNMLRARKRSQAVSVHDRPASDRRRAGPVLHRERQTRSHRDPRGRLEAYIKPGSRLYTTGTSLFGDVYGPQQSEVLPTVPSPAWDTLSDVCNTSFWAPYTRRN